MVLVIECGGDTSGTASSPVARNSTATLLCVAPGATTQEKLNAVADSTCLPQPQRKSRGEMMEMRRGELRREAVLSYSSYG
jgi:hypothetical protein